MSHIKPWQLHQINMSHLLLEPQVYVHPTPIPYLLAMYFLQSRRILLSGLTCEPADLEADAHQVCCDSAHARSGAACHRLELVRV